MITTERLHVRPVRRTDWPELKRIAEDFQASQYKIYDRKMSTDEKGVKSVAAYAEATGHWFAVCRRGEDRMLGYICLHPDNGGYDVGYCFHSSVHGLGYAGESIRAVLGFVTEVTGVRRFTAGAALDNLPSVRLLTRLGFRKVGEETLAFWQDAQGNDLSFRGGLYLLELPQTD